MAAPPFHIDSIFAATAGQQPGVFDDPTAMGDPMMGVTPTQVKRAGPKVAPPDPSAWNQFSFGDDFDWSAYDYVPDDDGGIWQLKPGFLPSAGRPRIIPLTVTCRSPTLTTDEVEWTCLSPACPSKPFKRKVDLDRHYRVCHVDPASAAALGPLPPAAAGGPISAGPASAPSAGKPSASPELDRSPNLSEKKDGVLAASALAASGAAAGGAAAAAAGSGTPATPAAEPFKCDYPACVRKAESFTRRERFRHHLMEHHKEDLPKKGAKLDDDWINTRKFSAQWWRCGKCLQRVKVELHKFECPLCGTKCEPKRQEVRLTLK